MTNEEIEKLDKKYRDEQAKKSSQHVQIPLVLNAYQLTNLLKAIRLSDNDGDWYHEILGSINFQISIYDLYLDEFPPHDKKYKRPLLNFPNTPYPDNFKLSNGNELTTFKSLLEKNSNND